ncbi:Retrotransposable element Tf2 protein [Rhizoctonia solani]|uniref:Retrotransposable element Tf2 protein n=1 Tax=Rhizoctonia solani TaxID=456999 RepID=A0A8H8T313_9AGAM|nr:Retrotransposable element Tf2 protein [Rhizoctonia solani]QRW26397.1 Retrotransposable element Tf2 protein [Rhizoctonia solani]
MTPVEREALKEHIDSEQAGKIVPTTSPAGAPVMFVKRVDGRLCLVMDDCWLNAITIKDRYAPPTQDILIEKLHHAKIFTKLNLRNGYHNIRIKKGDKWKAAFCTALGHFAPTVMQFGFSSALAVFMCFMNNIVHALLDISVVVYLDDILIFSNSREEHFFVTEVTYIGLVFLHGDAIRRNHKVQAIVDWPEPQNVKQVQSFLGFANFDHCFVPNFSCLAHPLNNLTQKEQPWIWQEEQKAAFDAIKAELQGACSSSP